jgi:hypothetical protein
VKRLPLILLLHLLPIAALAAELPIGEQRELALRFAPVLAFHPDEKYLPCSPTIWRSQKESPGLSGPSYEEASLEEKTRNAVIFYRVFDRNKERVVEYWIYYVNNAYRAGGGLFRFRSDTSHFNDLEFIFLILGREPSNNDWRIEKIISSAHNINNIHKMGFQKAPRRIQFLVELGSHAMAPDLDADGIFEPSLESRSNSKIVWGIRDQGSIWPFYSSSLSPPRTPPSAIFLYPEGSGEAIASSSRQFGYRLESIGRITEGPLDWMNQRPKNSLGLVSRVFGKPDGSSKSLVLPPLHPNFGKPGRAENNQAALERGLFVGYTPILYDYTLFAGYRFTQPSHSRYIPDATLDSYALLCGDGNDYYEFRMTGAYPVDAISRIFGGISILSDSIRFDDRQLNWVAGLEVRLNRFRFHSSFRSTGKISSAWMDFRLMWFF